jgi:hypothetical protein
MKSGFFVDMTTIRLTPQPLPSSDDLLREAVIRRGAGGEAEQLPGMAFLMPHT